MTIADMYRAMNSQPWEQVLGRTVVGLDVSADEDALRLRFSDRNSSNDYYDDWAELGKNKGYEWREITGDEWSA